MWEADYNSVAVQVVFYEDMLFVGWLTDISTPLRALSASVGTTN